jgi:hypothetical protein
MAGLVPAIHVLLVELDKKDVDVRNKCGHDEREVCLEIIPIHVDGLRV